MIRRERLDFLRVAQQPLRSETGFPPRSEPVLDLIEDRGRPLRANDMLGNVSFGENDFTTEGTEDPSRPRASPIGRNQKFVEQENRHNIPCIKRLQTLKMKIEHEKQRFEGL